MTDEELIEKLARAIGQCIEGDDEDMGRKWHGGPLWGAYVSEAEAVLPIIQADREAVRAETVKEIVAWLNRRAGQVLQLHAEAKTDHERNIVDEHASAIEQSAIEIEAKFGDSHD